LIILGSTQTERKVDVRFREEKDYFYMATKYGFIDNRWSEVLHNQNLSRNVPIRIKLDIEETYSGNSISTNFAGNFYFKLYDTKQIIKIKGIDK